MFSRLSFVISLCNSINSFSTFVGGACSVLSIHQKQKWKDWLKTKRESIDTPFAYLWHVFFFRLGEKKKKKKSLQFYQLTDLLKKKKELTSKENVPSLILISISVWKKTKYWKISRHRLEFSVLLIYVYAERGRFRTRVHMLCYRYGETNAQKTESYVF